MTAVNDVSQAKKAVQCTAALCEASLIDELHAVQQAWSRYGKALLVYFTSQVLSSLVI